MIGFFLMGKEAELNELNSKIQEVRTAELIYFFHKGKAAQ